MYIKRKITKSASGGQIEAVPSGVGKTRFPPVNYRAHKRRIQVALQRMPKPIQGILHSQQLRRLQQTKCLMNLYSRPAAVEVVHTPDSLGFYSRLFLVPKPDNRWRPVIDLSALNKFLAIPKFKMDTPESIHASLRKGEWVTSIDLTDAYLHVPIHPQSQKYLRFHFQGVTYQFTSLPFGLATATLIFTSIVKEVKLYIPGQLVNPCTLKASMHGTDSKTTKTGKGFGLYSQPQEVRPLPITEVRLLRKPFFARFGSCEAHTRQVDKASGDVPSPLLEVCYQCKDSYVHHWLTCIDGEDCEIGQDAYETFSVASQNSLEISDATGYTNPLESEDDTTRGMVVRPSKCATRRISPPQGTRKTNLYKHHKYRMGRSLRSKFYRRALVTHRKASSHQPTRTEGGSSGSVILPIREKLQNLPVGGRLRQFLPEWERLGSHRLITGLIRDGYKLPFRECPNLSRVSCIVSSYAGSNKQSAL